MYLPAGHRKRDVLETAWIDGKPASPEDALRAAGELLDAGRLQDGEPHLAGTARPAVARLSATTASSVGVADGEPLTVSTERGTVTLPLEVTDMIDGVVWLPMNSAGSAVHATLGVTAGQPVSIARGSL